MFTLNQPPFIATMLAHVDRVRCSSFCHNGHNLKELEAFSLHLFSHICRAQRGSLTALVMAHLLHFFLFPASISVLHAACQRGVLRHSLVSPPTLHELLLFRRRFDLAERSLLFFRIPMEGKSPSNFAFVPSWPRASLDSRSCRPYGVLSTLPVLHAPSNTVSYLPPASSSLFSLRQIFCGLQDHTHSRPRLHMIPSVSIGLNMCFSISFISTKTFCLSLAKYAVILSMMTRRCHCCLVTRNPTGLLEINLISTIELLESLQQLGPCHSATSGRTMEQPTSLEEVERVSTPFLDHRLRSLLPKQRAW